MPGFCPKCGDHVETAECEKCGEAVVATKASAWKDPIKTAGGSGEGYIPSAFQSAGRLQQSLGAYVPTPPKVRQNATALYDFMPQDKETQLRLRKGDVMEIIRKDSDGWWFVLLDGEKGLVPGAYVREENPVPIGPDPAILAAREASNQRFNQWRQAAGTTNGAGADPSVDSDSMYASVVATGPMEPRGPNQADARANDGIEDKPKVVRRLKKCHACKETILGRTKSAKGEIFHEICLICRGCREAIEEEDDFAIHKKKAYHADCAADIAYCLICDQELLGKSYKAAGASFHKKCMICPQCQKPFEENGATLEDDVLSCSACVAEKKRKEDEARAAARAAEEARLAAERAAEEARLAEKRAAEAREAELRQAEEREAAERAAEARAAEEQAAAAKAAQEAQEKAAEAAALAEETARQSLRDSEMSATLTSQRTQRSNSSFMDTSKLDEFDLGAASRPPNDRFSESTDLDDFDNDYGGSFASLNGERDSLRLSQVIDFGAVNAFNSTTRSTQNDRMSTLSDFSTISENEEDYSGKKDNGGAAKLNNSTLEEVVSEEEEDGEREACGGCGAVLEGEAIGALSKYFHYQCFKCSHCDKVIAEDDGYAEKDDMAFHRECYQARFSKRCCRCTKVLKGKVVKALDSLYHPDCFVCFQCNSSLSESFFEHDSQAVCAQCKHIAITANAAPVPDDPVALSVGTVGYLFAAQDETQLSIQPGQQVSILQKDDDGWWFVELDGQRGYVPGSYLIEHPVAPRKKKSPKPQPKKEEPKPEPKPEPKVEVQPVPVAAAAPAKIPGLCSECATQNPGVARFCRSCGNNLME